MFAIRNTAVLLAVLGFSATASAAPILDDLNTAVSVSNSIAGTTVSGPSQSGAGILGNRIVSVQIITGTGAFSGTSTIGGGQFSVGTSGANVNTNQSASYTFSAMDLSGSGSVDFTVSVFNPGTGNPPVTATVFLTDTSSGTQTVGSAIITGVGAVSIPLGATDRNATTNITLQFNILNNTDITIQGGAGIELIPGIPEPMTFATFGALALIGGYTARRKLKAAAVA